MNNNILLMLQSSKVILMGWFLVKTVNSLDRFIEKCEKFLNNEMNPSVLEVACCLLNFN